MRLREILTELGPCFIKLGQALSIRPDLLPSPVLFELQKLCDAVPSFPTVQALEVMSRELRCDPRDIFQDLDETTVPIAAASLGQVYKLKLKTTKETVAVKVQRPDMLAYILRDLYIMRRIAQVVEAVKKVVTRQRPYDVGLLDSFATASILELGKKVESTDFSGLIDESFSDYLNESKNQETFRRDLMPKMSGRIYIPRVYPELTTRKVLVRGANIAANITEHDPCIHISQVTEWIEGIKLAKSPPDVINRLTPVGVECFLIQLLDTGFFHADPHPGNLLVTQDGRLALIDFGLCANVPLPDTRNMTLAIVHLMQGDIKGLVQDAIDLGFLPPDVNVEKLQIDLQKVYDSAQLVMEQEYQKSKVKVKRDRPSVPNPCHVCFRSRPALTRPWCKGERGSWQSLMI